jgi:small ligand-binding sensory domain FIST
MRWARALGVEPAWGEALDAAAVRLQDALGGAPDVVLVVVAPEHAEGVAGMGGSLIARWPRLEAIAGGAAPGLWSDGPVREWPAVLLVGARWEGAAIDARVHHWSPATLSRIATLGVSAGEVATVGLQEASALVVFACPHTVASGTLLAALEAAAPGVPCVGAWVGVGGARGTTALVRGRTTVREGAVVLALHGEIEAEVAVVPDCAVVGPSWRVDVLEDGMIDRLDGRPALDVLVEATHALGDTARRALVRLPQLAWWPLSRAEGEADLQVHAILGVDEAHGRFALAVPVRVGDRLALVAPVDGEPDRRVLAAAAAATRRHGEPPAATLQLGPVDAEGKAPSAGWLGQATVASTRDGLALFTGARVLLALWGRTWN